MRITNKLLTLLEDCVITLEGAIKSNPAPRDEKVVLAPYSTSAYSFSRLFGFYNTNPKSYPEFKKLFAQYMDKIGITSEHIEYFINNKISQDFSGEKAKGYAPIMITGFKNHQKVLAKLIAKHYEKLFDKYESFTPRGIPVGVSHSINESEMHNSMVISNNHVNIA